MKYGRLSVLVVLLALLVGACASGRAGSPLYRRDIGVVSAGEAVTLAEQVITRHGYEIEHAETDPEIRVLTRWRSRPAMRDEQVLGITAAESRILVVGRLRGHTDLGALYNVTMTIENRVQVARQPDWNETLNTQQFRAYADEIANDFRQLVTNIGVRRF
jgi:hypothetical protein